MEGAAVHHQAGAEGGRPARAREAFPRATVLSRRDADLGHRVPAVRLPSDTERLAWRISRELGIAALVERELRENGGGRITIHVDVAGHPGLPLRPSITVTTTADGPDGTRVTTTREVR